MQYKKVHLADKEPLLCIWDWRQWRGETQKKELNIVATTQDCTLQITFKLTIRRRRKLKFYVNLLPIVNPQLLCVHICMRCLEWEKKYINCILEHFLSSSKCNFILCFMLIAAALKNMSLRWCWKKLKAKKNEKL